MLDDHLHVTTWQAHLLDFLRSLLALDSLLAVVVRHFILRQSLMLIPLELRTRIIGINELVLI